MSVQKTKCYNAHTKSIFSVVIARFRSFSHSKFSSCDIFLKVKTVNAKRWRDSSLVQRRCFSGILLNSRWLLWQSWTVTYNLKGPCASGGDVWLCKGVGQWGETKSLGTWSKPNSVQCRSIVLLGLTHIPMVKRECVCSVSLGSVVNGSLGLFWLS